MKNVRTGYISFVLLGIPLPFAGSPRAGGTSDPTWLNGSADLDIWLSDSLIWDATTLITSATLADNNGTIMSCVPGIIRPNTAWRVRPALKDMGTGDGVAVVTDFKSFCLSGLGKHHVLKLRVNPLGRGGDKIT